MFKTANPVLRSDVFSQERSVGSTMTLTGTINKSLLLLVLVLIFASYTWGLSFSQGVSASTPWMIAGGIVGFVVALVAIFKKTWIHICAPVYAVCQGLFLGGLSAVFELQYPGLVIQAVGLTFGTLFSLLVAYRAGWIQVTDQFRMGIVAATGGLVLVYFVGMILSFFGIHLGIFGNGIVGVIFSLIVVTVAALNLVLDFDFIEQGTRQGAPQYMEWYAAFGLLVTLIWLYVEMLRLLAKLRDRR